MGEGRGYSNFHISPDLTPNLIFFFRCLLSESGLVEGEKEKERKDRSQEEQLLHSTNGSFTRFFYSSRWPNEGKKHAKYVELERQDIAH